MKLDNLTKSIDSTSKIKLSWLRETSGQTSPETFLKVIE